MAKFIKTWEAFTKDKSIGEAILNAIAKFNEKQKEQEEE
tara:strand:- start:482 stop:598 length:117 start_codon:yes stop_codon:yes gene_type:complete